MKRYAAEYLYTLTSPEPVRGGFVELDEDGTVLHTGVCPDPSRETHFLQGALVPGFVNAHCHIELSYMKGLFRKGTGMAGFIDQINALRDTKSPELSLKQELWFPVHCREKKIWLNAKPLPLLSYSSKLAYAYIVIISLN